jgi:hypothetical protein
VTSDTGRTDGVDADRVLAQLSESVRHYLFDRVGVDDVSLAGDDAPVLLDEPGRPSRSSGPALG